MSETDSESNIVYRDDPSSRLGGEVGEGRREGLLIVNWQAEKGLISYELYTDAERHEDEQPNSIDERKQSEYIDHHLNEIAWSLNKPSSWPSIRLRIRGLGHKLATAILPSFLKDKIATLLNKGDVLKIATNESWIPWEIIFDANKGFFWGENFTLAREVYAGLVPHFTRPSKVYTETVSTIFHAIGNDTRCSMLAKSIFDELGEGIEVKMNNPGREEYYTVDDVITLLEDGADIIHFTCHGKINTLGERYLQLGPGAVDHHLYSFVLKTLNLGGKIIFINACSSIAPQRIAFNVLDDLSTFGSLIQLGGGGALIGTLAPITTRGALKFSREFYSRFLAEHKSIGHALFETKQTMAEEGAPHGLLYSLYGDPTLMKIGTHAAAREEVNR